MSREGKVSQNNFLKSLSFKGKRFLYSREGGEVLGEANDAAMPAGKGKLMKFKVVPSPPQRKRGAPLEKRERGRHLSIIL